MDFVIIVDVSIEEWLDKFRNAWVKHDIATVMSLYVDDVEYWETPHKRIGSAKELFEEWRAIEYQHDINLKTKVFSSTSDNKHSVIWRLSYVKDGKKQQFGGTYLISLNNDGMCYFFYHTGEELPSDD